MDIVVNISKVLSGDWDYVRADLKAVIDVAHDAGQKVKIIFENCYLQDEHKIAPLRDLRPIWAPTGSRPRPATAPAARPPRT